MRPKETEYASYYQKYIDTVEGDDIIWVLENQINEFHDFVNSIPEEKKTYSYGEGKWTIAEVIGHIIDTERILSFRALWFARHYSVPLPGFEPDDFIKYANFNRRSLRSLLEEWTHVRKSNNLLFANLGEESLHMQGTASNNPITVISLLYIIAGHLNHHIAILQERYLNE